MLYLKNVKKENGILKAMYYPEDSKEGKEISMDENLNFTGSLVGNGVDWEMHLAHARDKLRKMMLGKAPIEDQVVMWY